MELAPYEEERQPRLVMRGKKVLVPVESLRADVNCAICLNVMDNSAMTLECSHRFCKECIEKSIRLASNDCPTCRGKINTRRSLREDSRLDSLISIVFGNVEALEEREEQLKNTISRPNLSRNENITDKREPSLSPPISEEPTANSSSNMSSINGNGSSKRQKGSGPIFVGTSDDILFVLRKHPLDPLPSATKKEFIKAPIRLTVRHMGTFLLQQFRTHHSSIAKENTRFQILYYDAEGNEHVLREDDSVEDLLRQFKRSNRAADLVLHYRSM